MRPINEWPWRERLISTPREQSIPTRAEAERPKVELPPMEITEQDVISARQLKIDSSLQPDDLLNTGDWIVKLFTWMSQAISCRERQLLAAEAERDQAKAELAEMKWKLITPDSLPKVGDEVIRSKRKYHVHEVSPYSQQWDFERWTRSEYTHYRAINPPKP